VNRDAWETAGIVVGTLGGFLAFVGAVCAALVKAGRAARRVSRFLDEFLGHDGEPGLVERFETLTATVERISAQVFPNGGSSLRDAVDGVRSELIDHLRVADERTAELDELARKVRLRSAHE
jgi:transposase